MTSQTKRVRFLMIGGFLGAGKTTAIARLARHFISAGANVGVVTNDQAHDLVDTHSLRAQGFHVGEVPGACFCCKFDDLMQTVAGLGQENTPDIVIAEPVGSCTDLVATVIEPLRQLHGEQFELGPLAVLLKPEHGRKILGGSVGGGFSPKAEYIFLKQIEEADIVAVNKIDKLTAVDREELLRVVADRFPDKTILAVSARDGSGFDELISALESSPAAHEKLMEVDYDVYAAGEAELGWLNCTCQVRTNDGGDFDLDAIVVGLVASLRNELERAEVEPAHLKALGEAGQHAAIANLVGSGVEVELSLASAARIREASLIINARVAVEPLDLERIVRQTIDAWAGNYELDFEVGNMQRFRPGRPTPTHRITPDE